MKLKAKIILLLLIFSPLFISAENQTVVISGKIYFTHQKPIFIYLVDEEASKKPLSGLFSIVILPNHKDIEKGFITYQFDEINLGIYGIRCFQDMNNNKKIDKGVFGPSEPWGLSWNENKRSNWPKFSNFCFNAAESNKNIDLILEAF